MKGKKRILPTQREQFDLSAMDTLFLLDTTVVVDALRSAHHTATKALLLYLRTNLLEYSVRHPQRRCELRCGMGDLALHVERTNTPQMLILSAGGRHNYIGRRPILAPNFLLVVRKFNAQLWMRNDDWFASFKWVAYNGTLIEETTQ